MTNGLPTTRFGRTGLEVSRLGYGTWEIEGKVKGNPLSRPISQKQVSAVLNEALDSGVNLIDTADCYGRAEESIGEAVSHRRAEYYITTKCGCHPRGMSRLPPDTDAPKRFNRASVFDNLERSLKRLKTDYVDILQLHSPKAAIVEDNGLVEAMEEARQQGKVRWIGVSTDMPFLPPLYELYAFDVVQAGYQLLRREAEDWFVRLAAAGAGTIIRTAAAKGQHSGEGTLAYNQGRRLGPGNWESFEKAKLDELREDGESRVAFILRYAISRPQVHTVIVGTQSLDHLRENIAAVSRGPLSPDVHAEANLRVSALGFVPATISSA